jgi:hypothetical protein
LPCSCHVLAMFLQTLEIRCCCSLGNDCTIICKQTHRMPHTRSRRAARLIINDLQDDEIATKSACDDESKRLGNAIVTQTCHHVCKPHATIIIEQNVHSAVQRRCHACWTSYYAQ